MGLQKVERNLMVHAEDRVGSGKLGRDAESDAYPSSFYDALEDGSARSAACMVPLILSSLQPRSVLDVGCGRGVWLRVYGRHGLTEMAGVDRPALDALQMVIPESLYVSQDVACGFDLGRRFDLVQCLEVGEHLEREASRTLVANLVGHSDRVLFSAATPGQGGYQHVNEQPLSFWRELFAEHGYRPYDLIRPLVTGARDVQPWYRRNAILYVAGTSASELPLAVQASGVGANEAIRVMSTPLFRMRSLILRRLPVRVVSRLSRWKGRLVLGLQALRHGRRGVRSPKPARASVEALL